MPAPYLLDTNILLAATIAPDRLPADVAELPVRLLMSDAVLPRYSDLVTRVVLR